LAIDANYQMLSKALTPCFQANSKGLWRDLMFAAGLKLPGIQRLMYRSIAAPVQALVKQIPPTPSGRCAGIDGSRPARGSGNDLQT
jgi:hypothetical protein